MSDQPYSGEVRPDQPESTNQEIDLSRLAEALFKLLKEQLRIEAERRGS